MKKLFVLLAACSLFTVATVNAQSNVATPATTPTAVAPQHDAVESTVATDNAETKETTATKSSCKGKNKACCKDKSAKAEASKGGSAKASCCSKNKTEVKADAKSEDKSSVKQ